MIDITSIGTDIGLLDTQVPRAGNILSIQVGSLQYAQDLGIDLKYFLSEDFEFQNESFRSYLIQTLANRSINVASMPELVENLFTKYTVNLSPSANDKSLVAR
jgi:hypothetical protein